MSTFVADVTVLPKDGVLDTQGKAVEKTLKSQGFDTVNGVRVGKFVRITLEAENRGDAEAKLTAIADNVLVNDLIESYSFTLESVN